MHQAAGAKARDIALELSQRPDLWLRAVSTYFGLVPTRWWRRWPFLPCADAKWLGFRLETAYGNASVRPPARDIVEYLEWCQLSAYGDGLRNRRHRTR